MIGSLRGKLTFKQAPAVTIECNGVGYDVETPMSTFFELPAVGDELFIFTHLLVREDAQILYGFVTDTERALFRSVLKVRGVGARIGLAILSSMSVAGFNRCIEYEDVAALSKIPGMGKLAGAGMPGDFDPSMLMDAGQGGGSRQLRRTTQAKRRKQAKSKRKNARASRRKGRKK